MKNTKFFPFYIIFGITCFLYACEEKDIMTIDTSFAAINFRGDSIEYSFLENPEDEYIQEVNVDISGTVRDYDRTFNVEVIDSLTTAPKNQFEILDGTVKANQYEGTLSVKLYNSEELSDTTLQIVLKIIYSDDFSAGNTESNQFKILFSDKVVIPAWTYIRYFFCATSSTQCYRIFVETTGLLEFTVYDYINYGQAGTVALATKFGDYIMQWNEDHPDNHLKHDDGAHAGEDIVPIYYSHSKYD